ncbi:MAG: helix-turn-helix transcriptional regulator [Ruminococcaceae bacterium]|nr:helix-turn-helix transcriptional regulator [Oscillospiraceae bacterium]
MVEEKLTLGEKIKELRRAVGMSQLELANKIKVGKTTISNYENGYSIPTFDIREKLADALDASLEYFLSDEEIDNLSDNHIYFSRVTKIPVFEKNSSYEIITSNQNRYIPRYLEIPSCKNVRTGNFVSIQCPDNAMDNLNIKKGDFIVIETIESIPCLYNKLSFYLFKLA